MTLISALVAANLVVGAIFWVVRTAQDAFDLASEDADVVGSLTEGSGDVTTYLVVGSDSRAGLDDLTNFGNFSGQRGDVVMLVRLDTDAKSASMLSIPRDLYVDIPGHGKDKINAAFAYGGSRLMVETIKQNLHVEINHYVEVDFVGFMNIVDGVGGIDMSFPYPARDASSGLSVEAGPQNLDGKAALAYARSRKYQELRNGSWQPVDANDIGRTRRQQQVMLAIAHGLKHPSNITEAGDIVSGFARHLTIDSNLARSSVVDLFWSLGGISGLEIDGATLPTTSGSAGGASIELMQQPEAATMLSNFRSGLPLGGSTASLQLQVLNGNGVTGAATHWSQFLTDRGFRVASIGDASTNVETTRVIVPPGGETDGLQVVSALGFGEVSVGPVGTGLNAVVIVGSDAR